jgi:hypothetical protein
LSLIRKISITLGALLISSALISVSVLAWSLRNDLDRSLKTRVARSKVAVDRAFAHEREVLQATASALSEGPGLKAVLAGGELDAASLESVADEQRASARTEVLFLTDAEGRVRVASPRGVSAPPAGFSSRAPWVDGERVLVQVWRPVEVGGRVVGGVSVGVPLDEGFVTALRDEVGLDAVLRVKERITASATQVDGAALAETNIAEPNTAATVAAPGITLVAARLPLSDGADLLVFANRDAEFEQFYATLARLLLVSLLSISLTLAALIFFLRRVRERVDQLLGQLVETATQLRQQSSNIKLSCNEQAASTTQHAAAVEETRATVE